MKFTLFWMIKCFQKWSTVSKQTNLQKTGYSVTILGSIDPIKKVIWVIKGIYNIKFLRETNLQIFHCVFHNIFLRISQYYTNEMTLVWLQKHSVKGAFVTAKYFFFHHLYNSLHLLGMLFLGRDIYLVAGSFLWIYSYNHIQYFELDPKYSISVRFQPLFCHIKLPTTKEIPDPKNSEESYKWKKKIWKLELQRHPLNIAFVTTQETSNTPNTERTLSYKNIIGNSKIRYNTTSYWMRFVTKVLWKTQLNLCKLCLWKILYN